MPTPCLLKKFNIIICIEAWHTFPNTDRILKQVSQMIEENGKFVIADGFAVDKIAEYEQEFM